MAGWQAAAWLWRRMGQQRTSQAPGVLVMALGSILALADPFVIRWIVDVVIPQRRGALLAAATAVICLSYGARGALIAVGGRLAWGAHQRFVLDLRRDVLRRLVDLSADYQDTTPVGTKLHVVRDSVDELTRASEDFLPLLFRSVGTLAWIVVAMAVLKVELLIIILPVPPVFVLLVRRFQQYLRTQTEDVRRADERVGVYLQELLSTVMQVQLLNAQHRRLRRARAVWLQLLRSQRRYANAELWYAAATTAVAVVTIGAVIGYGGMQVLAGTLTLGSLVAFYSYTTRAFEPLYILVDLGGRVERMAACIDVVNEVLARTPSVAEPHRPVPWPAASEGTSIDWHCVHFAYPGRRPVLNNVTLHIARRERVALVGHTGCGKTTMARLVVRLYDPSAGRVCLDGNDVRSLRLADLREHVCYLPQHTVLFDESLEGNVRLGRREATREEVERALSIAQLDRVVRALPGGWRQPLGPQGELLSGGERQRVAIARAVLRRPPVLILDESTSELDVDTEHAILTALTAHLSTSTVLFISHRETALAWADRVIHVDTLCRLNSPPVTDALATDTHRAVASRESSHADLTR